MDVALSEEAKMFARSTQMGEGESAWTRVYIHVNRIKRQMRGPGKALGCIVGFELRWDRMKWGQPLLLMK